MNFTREPIIETVITPREGCKLVVRSSKANGQEDYFVDAVEVVSFGHSFFFRSSEKPKSFLVPVSDYEILELRETRMVLKHVATERSVKIGGGRDAAPPRHHREPEQKQDAESSEEEAQPASAEVGNVADPRSDRNKRDRRRRGRRGRSDRPAEARDPAAETPVAEGQKTEQTHLEETPAAEKPIIPPFRIFAPPPIYRTPTPKAAEESVPETKPREEESLDSFQDDSSEGNKFEE